MSLHRVGGRSRNWVVGTSVERGIAVHSVAWDGAVVYAIINCTGSRLCSVLVMRSAGSGLGIAGVRVRDQTVSFFRSCRTSSRPSISRNNDPDGADKDSHIFIIRYFLFERLGTLLTIGHSYRTIRHTGLVPKQIVDPESAFQGSVPEDLHDAVIHRPHTSP